MRKPCSGAVQPAPRRSPQASSMWNEWLRARLPCNHSLATVRRSAIDSVPLLSTAQGVCRPVLTIAYVISSVSSAPSQGRSSTCSVDDHLLPRMLQFQSSPRATVRVRSGRRRNAPALTLPFAEVSDAILCPRSDGMRNTAINGSAGTRAGSSDGSGACLMSGAAVRPGSAHGTRCWRPHLRHS